MSNNYWEAKDNELEKEESVKEIVDLKNVDLKVSRVAQLDADLLDNELKEILSTKLFTAVSLFKSDIKTMYEPELVLGLQSVLFYFSFRGKFKASYGAMLQNLRFQNDFSPKNFTTTSISDPTLLQVSLYGALTIGGQYLWSKWLNSGVGGGWGDEVNSHTIKYKIYKAISSLEKWVKLINLIHFLHFIYNGRYRGIIERILGLRLVPARKAGIRQLNFEFLNRQMVWDGFAEFLLFIAPLINLPKLSNKLKKILFKFGGNEKEGMYSVENQKILSELPTSTCAYCYYYKNLESHDASQSNHEGMTQEEIIMNNSNSYHPNFIGALNCRCQLAYSLNCDHLLCYQCLSILISSNDSNPPCPRCHVPITNYERFYRASD